MDSFCIMFFSITYMLCADSEFAGWISSVENKYTGSELKKLQVFRQYAKHKYFITKDEFLEIPIYKINKSFIIKPSKNSPNQKHDSIRRVIYDLYALKEKNTMTIKQFLKIPFSVANIKLDKKYKLEESAITLQKGRIVKNYFDRLYFSAVTQTTLG